MRTLYHCLVALHPPAFRRQFGAQMESIFDECGRPARLVGDVLVSLIRQWVWRGPVGLFALAAAGGLIPFALGFGFLQFTRSYFGVSPVHRPLHRVAARGLSQPVTEPFIMMTAVIALLFISGTMTLAIAWFRHSQQRKKA